jgi:hypothetical protein
MLHSFQGFFGLDFEVLFPGFSICFIELFMCGLFKLNCFSLRLTDPIHMAGRLHDDEGQNKKQ